MDSQIQPRVFNPPDGYVPLGDIGRQLGIGYSTFLEYAKRGVIAKVLKLESRGHVRWFIDQSEGQRLIDDERAGRTVPWSDPGVVAAPRKPCPQCNEWVAWRRDESRTMLHCCRLPEFLEPDADEHLRRDYGGGGGPLFAIDAAGDIVQDPHGVVATLALRRDNRQQLAATFRDLDTVDVDMRLLNSWRELLPVYLEEARFIDNALLPTVIAALAIAAVRLPQLEAQFQQAAARLTSRDDELSRAAFALIKRTFTDRQ